MDRLVYSFMLSYMCIRIFLILKTKIRSDAPILPFHLYFSEFQIISTFALNFVLKRYIMEKVHQTWIQKNIKGIMFAINTIKSVIILGDIFHQNDSENAFKSVATIQMLIPISTFVFIKFEGEYSEDAIILSLLTYFITADINIFSLFLIHFLSQ